jgi:hypothetical protein
MIRTVDSAHNESQNYLAIRTLNLFEKLLKQLGK